MARAELPEAEAQAAKPARTQPGEAILLRFRDPQRPAFGSGGSCSSKILKTSRVSESLTSTPRRLISPGQHWKASAAGHWLNSQSSWSPRSSVSCLDALHARGPKNLGEISYGNELIRQGTYSVQVFPLSRNFVGVAFENVTERKLAEQALRENDERFRLLIEGVKEYAIFRLTCWARGQLECCAERPEGLRAEEIIGQHSPCFILEKM